MSTTSSILNEREELRALRLNCHRNSSRAAQITSLQNVTSLLPCNSQPRSCEVSGRPRDDVHKSFREHLRKEDPQHDACSSTPDLSPFESYAIHYCCTYRTKFIELAARKLRSMQGKIYYVLFLPQQPLSLSLSLCYPGENEPRMRLWSLHFFFLIPQNCCCMYQISRRCAGRAGRAAWHVSKIMCNLSQNARIIRRLRLSSSSMSAHLLAVLKYHFGYSGVRIY